MPASLLLMDDKGARMVDLSEGAWTLGRASENDVVLKGMKVSRVHAVLHVGPDGAVLRDNESSNGTYVNGQRIRKRPLQRGDTILLGDRALRFMLRPEGVDASELSLTTIFEL